METILEQNYAKLIIDLLKNHTKLPKRTRLCSKLFRSNIDSRSAVATYCFTKIQTAELPYIHGFALKSYTVDQN